MKEIGATHVRRGATVVRRRLQRFLVARPWPLSGTFTTLLGFFLISVFFTAEYDILVVKGTDRLKGLGSGHYQPPTPDPRFGVIESYESPDEATELGAGWTRVTFEWSRIQSGGPQTWTPKVTDGQIEAEIAAGRDVIGLLIGIPDWARDENLLPSGLWLPHDDPSNTWARFVRRAVTHYEGKVNHWIIWNEPDIQETEIAHTWDGSVADFAQLMRVAYLVAKDANPDIVIHLSAFTYWADYYRGSEQYMARLIDTIMEDPLAVDNNYYFDIATAHLYFQPNQVYDLLEFFVDIMRQRDLDQPIWLVETNAPPMDDPAWPVPDWFLSVKMDEQASYIPQALSSALAAGAGRIAIYKLKDTEDDRLANPEPFGLLRLDGSRRPAFDSFRIAVNYLGGMISAERERWDEVGQIRIDQPGQTTTVLFSRLPSEQRALVKATADSAQLVDMWGDSHLTEPEGGVFIIDLPAALCSQSIGDYCMIGGQTYYLVQPVEIPPTPSPTMPASITAPASPPATSSPPVESTAVPPVTVTLTPSPSVTPSPVPIETPSPTEETGIDQEASSPEPSAGILSNSGLLLIAGGILLASVLLVDWFVRRRR